MVSSCGPSSHWHSAAPMCHITPFFTLSWEIVTTLDYEWNVIRGRRPYPHSITFSLGHGLPSLLRLFAVDRASHVRLLLKRSLQISWRIPESPFGTGIRLSLLLRLVYG